MTGGRESTGFKSLGNQTVSAKLLSMKNYYLLALIYVACCGLNIVHSQDADWPEYLGGKGRDLYSTLDQINRSNVSKLQVAWTYETGNEAEYQANNLIVEGVLYTPTATRKVIALDAATGDELWQWDPANEHTGAGSPRQRGLMYWTNETGGEQRLFTGVNGFLFAIDLKTGETIREFGENGSINLHSGLNTPGVTYKGLLILGGLGGKGSLRAFDVRTGEQRWIFHLIPHPGEMGYETWPENAFETATGVMPWSGQSLDEERGIVYAATKTAEPDFYGGERLGVTCSPTVSLRSMRRPANGCGISKSCITICSIRTCRARQFC